MIRMIFSTRARAPRAGLDRRVVGHQADRPPVDRRGAGDDAVGAADRRPARWRSRPSSTNDPSSTSAAHALAGEQLALGRVGLVVLRGAASADARALLCRRRLAYLVIAHPPNVSTSASGSRLRQDERVSEYRDPPGEAPWAMPIVVRAEKGAEPTAAAVAEAAATAVVQLLEDPRSIDGEWHAEVQRWLDGRIRKVARRARGSRWDAAVALPGVTVVHHGASVRAFVPGPTDAVPPQIAKLQVAGLDLEPGTPAAATSGVLAIAVTPHVTMSPLKAAVQVAHAAQSVAWGTG